MRTIPIGLANKYAAETQRLAQFLRLERKDGLVVGLTSADVDVVIGGVTYLAQPGITPTNIVWTSGLNVDNLEVTFTEDDIYINKVDVLSKKWSKTRFYLFQADPLDPAAGIDTLMVGHMGDVSIDTGSMRAELRSVLQLLQQTIGEVTSKTCKTQLFSAKCRVPEYDHTFPGTITSAGRQVVADSVNLQPDDWFGDGLFEFTSGDCNGMQVKVRDYDGTTGAFTFVMPMLLTPSVGDSYIAKTGCRKRVNEDCRDKFDNILNFQGEPHLPGNDYITNPGDVSNA